MTSASCQKHTKTTGSELPTQPTKATQEKFSWSEKLACVFNLRSMWAEIKKDFSRSWKSTKQDLDTARNPLPPGDPRRRDDTYPPYWGLFP